MQSQASARLDLISVSMIAGWYDVAQNYLAEPVSGRIDGSTNDD